MARTVGIPKLEKWEQRQRLPSSAVRYFQDWARRDLHCVTGAVPRGGGRVVRRGFATKRAGTPCAPWGWRMS